MHWCGVFIGVLAVLAAGWAAHCRSSLPPLRAFPAPHHAPFRAVVLGASGACGSALVRELVAAPDVSEVTLISRREVPEFNALPTVTQHVIDLSDPEILLDGKHGHLFQGRDVAFMSAGMGSARKAGSKAALKAVDVGLSSAFGRAARTAGVPHMSLLTAIGADSSSPDSVNGATAGGSGTYNQIKGIVEDDMIALAFPGSLRIFRPAAILGTPHTPGFVVDICPWIQPLLPGQYKCSSVSQIAKGMLAEARNALAAGHDTSTRVLHVPDYTSAAGIQI